MKKFREEIYVAKPSLPRKKDFIRNLSQTFQTHRLTTNGPLANEFKKRLEKKLKVKNLLLVSNATKGLEIAIKTFQPQKKTIKVFTDGSTINNGKRVEIVSGGVGVYFGKNDARNISKKVISKKVTNNVCELIACILAIEQVINSEDTMDFVEVKIYSDSEYTINSVIKWADNWEKNDYKKKVKGKWVDVKNVVYIKKLREYYKKYNIKFYYTPAHKAQPDPRKDKEKYDQWYGNYMADHLAKCASQN